MDLARQQPEKLEEWLDRIERESGRMDALVGKRWMPGAARSATGPRLKCAYHLLKGRLVVVLKVVCGGIRYTWPGFSGVLSPSISTTPPSLTGQ